MHLENKRAPGRRMLVWDHVWEEGPEYRAEKGAGMAGRRKDCKNTEVTVCIWAFSLHLFCLPGAQKLKKKLLYFSNYGEFARRIKATSSLSSREITCEFRDI